MSVKPTGRTAYSCFKHFEIGAIPWDMLLKGEQTTWERVEIAVLTTHAPKISAEDVCLAVRYAKIEVVCTAHVGETFRLGIQGSARIADHLNAILSAPKAPAQEQGWDTMPIGTKIQKGDQLKRVENLEWKDADWTAVGSIYIADQYELRRPRRPQQAGKESPPPDENDLSEWTTHTLLISKEGEAKLAELYKDAPKIMRSDMLALEARAKEINTEEAADPILIGGWPIKEWEQLKTFLISYSMFHWAAMIRWVIREGPGAIPSRTNVELCAELAKQQGELTAARQGLLSEGVRSGELETQLDTARAELAKVKGELLSSGVAREEMEKSRDRWQVVAEEKRMAEIENGNEIHTLKSQLEISHKEVERTKMERDHAYSREAKLRQNQSGGRLLTETDIVTCPHLQDLSDKQARNIRDYLNEWTRTEVVSPWTLINPSDPATLPKECVVIIGYAPSWKDEDFNPEGIRECFLNGDGSWLSAEWNNSQDCWETDTLTMPDYWMSRPIPPLLTPAPEVNAFEKWWKSDLRGLDQYKEGYRKAYAAGQAQGGDAK